MLKILILLVQEPYVMIFGIITVLAGREEDVMNDSFMLVSLAAGKLASY